MTHTLTSGALVIELTQSESGIALKRIHDNKTGKDILSGAGTLFLLTAEKLDDGTEVVLSSDKDFPVCAVQTVGNVTTLTCRSSEKLPGVTVCITLQCIASQNRIEYETALLSENADYALTQCDYPALWFDVKKSVKFLSPYGCGEAIDSDAELFGHAFRSGQDYPSYGVSMAFMATWDRETGRCIYYGVEDPQAASKKFWFIRELNAPQMCIKGSQILKEIDKGANSQTLYGKAVWQLTDGDWYDATLLYRNWMESHASWMPVMENGVRKDASWEQDIDAWFLVHINNEHFADAILDAAADLGGKIAVHLYLWHQNPFDNDYPHYFPEKEFVSRELKRLQEAGIKVIPYINGRLWDTRDRGLEDWEFTAKAKAFACKDRHGKVFTESYSAKEDNGEHVVLANMCPSTAIWKDTLCDVTGQLMQRIGFDGVYIDQIAAAKAQPCADPTHDHVPGGGSWWTEQYNTLLGEICHHTPGAVLATECTAEMFMKHIQLYLSWLWVKNDQVPAFPVLYSDKVSLFGLSYHSFGDRDPDGMAIFYAQNLLFGEQMGWLSPEVYNVMPHKEFFKDCVRMRARLHNVLSHGIMLRPPVLSDDAPRLHCEKVGHAYFRTVDYPAVQGALWQEKETGKQFLLLTNSQTIAANVSLNTVFPDGTYTLTDQNGTPCEKLTVRNGVSSLTLPPHAVRVAVG